MSPRRSWPRRILRTSWVVILAAALIPPTAGGVALATYLLMDDLPSTLPEERRQADSFRSIVYAADGSEIGEFRAGETRVVIDAAKIPKTIKDAVIAAEDRDFYGHDGVDWQATSRALWADLQNRQIKQGGSTITQQLVKNLYVGNERSFTRKVKEALVAADVERAMEKDEILAKYLNTVYMGDSVFGVEAASVSYFRKHAEEITLSEAALLVGVLPAPSRYSPRTHQAAAEVKRQLVLDAIGRSGLRSPEEVAAARAEIPTIHPVPAVRGRYPYFLDYLRVYLLDVVKMEPDLLYRGGLKIETTLEPRLEDKAIAVLSKTLPGEKDPEASLVAVEPQTGFVRALVGGRNWDTSKVNLALGKFGGGSGRQAGSSFKPFVQARALDAGVSPNKVYPAPSCVQPKGFTKKVCNYGGGGYGSATLTRALAQSINTVYVQLIVDVGIKQTAEMAQRLGITSINPDKAQGGIAIGTQEVSPLDMAAAFSVFAGRGIKATPTPVLTISDYEGNVIEDNTQSNRGERVLEEAVADNMNQMLRGVIEGGTGTSAKLGRPAAGKTGTSQNNENAWFVGYTPTLSTAVWMGYPKGNIPMRGVRGVGEVTGGSHPARMWKAFMAEAIKDVPVTDFTEPAPIESLADRAKREQRGGFDLGGQKATAGLPSDGPYYTPPPVPAAVAPPVAAVAAEGGGGEGTAGEGEGGGGGASTTTTSSTTTTTTAPATKPSSTTTTTKPGLPNPSRGRNSTSTSTSTSSTTTTTSGDEQDEG